MALQADEELFKSAISGYRDAFLVRHSHLPESERNRLWSQQLSQFIPVDREDAALGKPGKRTRQDATPRTLLGSGPPQAKRRATVCLTLVSCSSSSYSFTSYFPIASPGLTIGRARISRRPTSCGEPSHNRPLGMCPDRVRRSRAQFKVPHIDIRLWCARRASRFPSPTGTRQLGQLWASDNPSDRAKQNVSTMLMNIRHPNMRSTWMTPTTSPSPTDQLCLWGWRLDRLD